MKATNRLDKQQKVKIVKDIFEVAKHNPLWGDMGYSDFVGMIRCMNAKTRKYNKGDFVLLSGDAVDNIGLIVSVSVKVIKEDIDGNISILTELAAPDLFGEAFACANIDYSTVAVQASEKCAMMG
jgi:hypothetical protein